MTRPPITQWTAVSRWHIKDALQEWTGTSTWHNGGLPTGILVRGSQAGTGLHTGLAVLPPGARGEIMLGWLTSPAMYRLEAVKPWITVSKKKKKKKGVKDRMAMKLSRGAQGYFSAPYDGGKSIRQWRVHGERRNYAKVTFLHTLVNKLG